MFRNLSLTLKLSLLPAAALLGLLLYMPIPPLSWLATINASTSWKTTATHCWKRPTRCSSSFPACPGCSTAP